MHVKSEPDPPRECTICHEVKDIVVTIMGSKIEEMEEEKRRKRETTVRIIRRGS